MESAPPKMDYTPRLAMITAIACVVLLAGSIYLFMQIQQLQHDKSAKIGYVRSDVFLSSYRPAIAVQKMLEKQFKPGEEALAGKYQ